MVVVVAMVAAPSSRRPSSRVLRQSRSPHLIAKERRSLEAKLKAEHEGCRQALRDEAEAAKNEAALARQDAEERPSSSPTVKREARVEAERIAKEASRVQDARRACGEATASPRRLEPRTVRARRRAKVLPAMAGDARPLPAEAQVELEDDGATVKSVTLDGAYHKTMKEAAEAFSKARPASCRRRRAEAEHREAAAPRRPPGSLPTSASEGVGRALKDAPVGNRRANRSRRRVNKTVPTGTREKTCPNDPRGPKLIGETRGADKMLLAMLLTVVTEDALRAHPDDRDQRLGVFIPRGRQADGGDFGRRRLDAGRGRPAPTDTVNAPLRHIVGDVKVGRPTQDFSDGRAPRQAALEEGEGDRARSPTSWSTARTP